MLFYDVVLAFFINSKIDVFYDFSHKYSGIMDLKRIIRGSIQGINILFYS